MSFWPQSRYTASLEQQVKELKEEILRLREQNDELAAMLVKRLEPGEVVTAGFKTKASDREKKELPLPKVGNWLRTRSSLESTDQISELDPDKENSANGIR